MPSKIAQLKNGSPLISLIISNLLPLAGVLFFRWDIATILFMYWFENIVIGICNCIKMAKAQGKTMTTVEGVSKPDPDKRFFIAFFLFHYGFFTLGHGIFVFTFFGIPDAGVLFIFLSIISLFVSHGVSYIRNFINKGEYKKVSPKLLFIQPYKRIVIIHLTILLGGGITTITGNSLTALIILIGLKISLDIFFHKLEHKKFESSPYAPELGQIGNNDY
ncbi:MAG: DUF6498-containing protein [Candidatus Magasanikbacteria bacterium]